MLTLIAGFMFYRKNASAIEILSCQEVIGIHHPKPQLMEGVVDTNRFCLCDEIILHLQFFY
jgi:hypothetical protein